MRFAARRTLMFLFAVAIIIAAAGCSSDDEAQTVDFGGETEQEAAEPDAATSTSTDSDSDADSDSDGDTESDADNDSDGDTDGVDVSQYYFDGTTRDNLPADQDERFDIMYDWIELNLDSNSGYSYGSSGTEVQLEFSIDAPTADEAATQCDTYRGLAAAYLFDAELAEITLAGWVLGPDGSFGEADWDPITCEI